MQFELVCLSVCLFIFFLSNSKEPCFTQKYVTNKRYRHVDHDYDSLTQFRSICRCYMKKHIKANKTQDWLTCTMSLQRFIKYFEGAIKFDRVCFYLQAMMEPVLVKVEAFTMNGRDGVSDGACFYLHDVVVCF